jgi:hypothetical protein
MSAELLELQRRNAVRKDRNDILHPILIGGADLKRIADQIARSFLDPLGAEGDASRIEAVGEDQAPTFAFDGATSTGMEHSIADLHDRRREPLSRTSTRHGRAARPFALSEFAALRDPARGVGPAPIRRDCLAGGRSAGAAARSRRPCP